MSAPGSTDPIEEYLQTIMAIPPLTPDEERLLWQAIERETGDDAAKRRLIEASLKLVIPIARRYEGRGLAFVDLAEEGNLGLIRAVALFDPSADEDFATFANQKIEDAITGVVG